MPWPSPIKILEESVRTQLITHFLSAEAHLITLITYCGTQRNYPVEGQTFVDQSDHWNATYVITSV